jgi:hypothetical protein
MKKIICPNCGHVLNNKKCNKESSKKLNDKAYSYLLNYYKDHIINDLKKFNYNVSQLSIEWNCTENLMNRKLNKWGVINFDKNLYPVITKDALLKEYKERKNVKSVALYFNVSESTIYEKMKKFQIPKISYFENKNYEEIISDKEKLKEFFDYSVAHNKKELASKYNISIYYVNRILKEKGNENE